LAQSRLRTTCHAGDRASRAVSIRWPQAQACTRGETRRRPVSSMCSLSTRPALARRMSLASPALRRSMGSRRRSSPTPAGETVVRAPADFDRSRQMLFSVGLAARQPTYRLSPPGAPYQLAGGCNLGKQSAPQIAASQEGVPALFGGVVSLNLINAFATNRTKTNMNPPTAVPYITEAGP